MKQHTVIQPFGADLLGANLPVRHTGGVAPAAKRDTCAM
jgi:hypothetical protein